MKSLNARSVIFSNNISKISWIFLLSTFFSWSLNGQQKATFIASRGSPVIDGEIGPGEWNISGPVYYNQMEPFKNQPSTEPVRMAASYDNSNIYFLFICLDPNPSAIVSNIAVRDGITISEDFILIQLDTYMDSRTAYTFMINPLGTQSDFLVADDGKTMDSNWDAEWFSATSVNDSSWIVEVAIPFKSLRYNKNLNAWGFNAARMHRSLSELSTWTGPLNHYNQVSTGGVLDGLDLSGTARSLSVTPYATLRYEDSDISGKHNRFIPDAGVDAKWQFTRGSVANLTVNPDFATVEGDQEEINLTRWEIQFPEKRLFFLEGNEMYQTRIRTFYSRRIGDIYGGAKVAGKEGKYSYSALGAYSERDEEGDSPPAFYTAARVKRDVLRSSSVGLTFTDKSDIDGFARTFSGDYLLNLGKDWKLTGQFVGSAPGDFYDHSAYFVRFAKESNIYHAHLRYSYTGKDFMETVNKTGFIREDDMQEFDSDLYYQWWLKRSVFKYIFFASYNNIFWNYNYSYLRSWDLTQRIQFYFRNRISVDLSYNNEYKLYDKDYYNHMYEIELGYNTDEWSSAELGYYWGRNFDRHFKLYTAEGSIRFWKKLSVELEMKYLEFDPDPGKQTTWINILSLEYYFKRDLWARVFTQNNTVNDRIYFYGLFGWRFRPPFAAVYLIYTLDDYMNIEADTRLRSDIFFIKFSYQFGQ